jgi:hypothetical protein
MGYFAAHLLSINGDFGLMAFQKIFENELRCVYAYSLEIASNSSVHIASSGAYYALERAAVNARAGR